MFKKAVGAGIFISVGATVYLANSPVLGSFLFAIGLLSVVVYKQNLYTGKIGYLIQAESKILYLKQMLITVAGNAVGVGVCVLLLKNTRYYNTSISEKINKVVDLKLSDDVLSIFILSIFCGIIMYIVVHNYYVNNDKLLSTIYIILGVMVFILAGFEHSIANLFYFLMASSFTPKTVAYLMIMLIGNGVGAMMICKLLDEDREQHKI